MSGFSLAAEDLPWPEAVAVGSWRNRAFNPELDLVGADRAPVARTLCYVGPVKWLGQPFDDHDLSELQRGAAAVPGFDPGGTSLVAVSRAGFDDSGGDRLALRWNAQDVAGAFG